ncbi:MAG TPA: CoB--CoM heterodisulfide reductase iron-sulfur subunit A family protein [Bacteroidales bacterium]|nr:CoB--CoM heterodisulfide reductase iron-sulfur subunit A family protein [Bacteroidales bacterium]
MEDNNKKERIGVYICHCGGNISDYVDVARIRELVKSEEGVVISKNVMFACSDSNQKEMIQDIRDQHLDAIVVASCSPKLHLHTFRNVAKRAGLNEYNYTQVNIREQCSWAHSDTPKDATLKAAGLIRAGIKKVTHSEALENIEVSSTRAGLVIGGGVAGMRAAIELARMGNQVYLLEREKALGGQVARWGELFMNGSQGKNIIEELNTEIRKSSLITVFTGAGLEKVSGSLGNFVATVRVSEETLSLKVGAILVATGSEPYQPREGEFGYGTFPFVITLPEFKELIDRTRGELVFRERKIRRIAYVYCVGMRQTKGENKYCSRICCTTAIHSSLLVHEKFPGTTIFHLYRDIRTYGKQEILYEHSSKNGDIYLKFDEKSPPVVEQGNGNLNIRVRDELTRKQDLELEADLVVLVTGMVPGKDHASVSEKLKIPVGNDKFFNEIHPKLRPVETVINGVFLGGSCQGPKNISESVQSSLSAAVKINALTRKPSIQLEPIIARVDFDACVWCGKCAEVCEYDAIHPLEMHGKVVASVNEAVCKGCGICAPVCPADAIDIAQYSNREVEGMIDGFMKKVELTESGEGKEEAAPEETFGMKDQPQLWRKISASLDAEPKTIPALARELAASPELITYHLMTMNKYNFVEPAGMDDADEYYLYKLKNSPHVEN